MFFISCILVVQKIRQAKTRASVPYRAIINDGRDAFKPRESALRPDIFGATQWLFFELLTCAGVLLSVSFMLIDCFLAVTDPCTFFGAPVGFPVNKPPTLPVLVTRPGFPGFAPGPKATPQSFPPGGHSITCVPFESLTINSTLPLSCPDKPPTRPPPPAHLYCPPPLGAFTGAPKGFRPNTQTPWENKQNPFGAFSPLFSAGVSEANAKTA